MKSFKTLNELQEHADNSIEKVLGNVVYTPPEDSHKKDTWERLKFDARPHEAFKLDWKTYSSLGFANTFLPYIKKGYKGHASYFFDGAKIFQGLQKVDRKVFAYTDTQNLTTVVTYTFPQGVLAAQLKNRVQPAKHEVCVFIEVDKSGTMNISFKFGEKFKKILKKVPLPSSQKPQFKNVLP